MFIITVQEKDSLLETRLVVGCLSGAEEFIDKLQARGHKVTVDETEEVPERDMAELDRVAAILKSFAN